MKWSPHSIYWLQQTAEDVPESDDWLCANELARLSGLRIPKRRNDWRLGRWTAKQAVAAILSQPLSQIEIRPAPDGAPEVYLRCGAGTPACRDDTPVVASPATLNISLTHTANIAICALSPPHIAIGCDLEQIEQRSPVFVEDYFTPAEQSGIASSPNPQAQITLLWSAKESALKALREGLRLDTRSVVVTPTPDGHLTVQCNNGRIFQGWWQREANLIRTLVADPATNPPINLKVHPQPRHIL